MSWMFYNSVIEQECKLYDVERQSLDQAFKNIGKAYSEQSLKRGDSFVDYNNPKNRCAYLHKFAALHTSLVHNFFNKCIKKREVKKILSSKKTLNICCIGGGPGSDIIGLFRTLVLYPQFHKKVVKVVILDISRGWSNSFKFIISSLLEGKVKNVPPNFIDTSRFIAEIIEVNLLETLPVNVVEAIAAADIVSSIKFISAIFSHPTSSTALKTITDILKPGAVFFFIDNMRHNVYTLVETVCKLSGLKIVLGPVHGNYAQALSKKSQSAFKCNPLIGTMVSVIGSIKLKDPENISNGTIFSAVPSLKDSDDSWISDTEWESVDAELEIDDDINIQSSSSFDAEDLNQEILPKENKCIQTDTDTNCVPSYDSTVHLENVLESLATALNSLVVNVDKFMQTTYEKKCCCCCRC